jgi:hypothetical protein
MLSHPEEFVDRQKAIAFIKTNAGKNNEQNCSLGRGIKICSALAVVLLLRIVMDLTRLLVRQAISG